MLKKLSLIFFAVLVTGCSDPKTANEKNFQDAIQSYLDTTYPKCYFHHQFPATLEHDFGGTKKILHALTKAGLLTESEVSRKEVSRGGSKQTVITNSYDLTDEGRKFYKPEAKWTLTGNVGGFCVGKASVRNITQFSQPSDVLGQTFSEVNYTYVVTDLPLWVQTPEVRSAIDGLAADLESEKTPLKDLETLVLTNNGWVHQHLFRSGVSR